jgi:hypothetical protein
MFCMCGSGVGLLYRALGLPVSALALAAAARCLLFTLKAAIVASRVTREFCIRTRLLRTASLDLETHRSDIVSCSAGVATCFGTLSGYTVAGLN